MPGPDRLVRLRLDARRHANEHAGDAGLGRPRRLVGSVENDECTRSGGRTQLLVRLVVSVHDEAVTLDPGALREGQLAERRDVGAEPFLGE